jgi:hypothetical protein
MVIEALPPNTHPAIASEPAASAKMVFSENVKLSPTIPAFISAHQTYYWSSQWQESERQALADLASGHARTFADPNDAARYLLGEPE